MNGIVVSDMGIGDRVKALRLASGLTPEALAQLAKVSRGYIQKLERGQSSEPSYIHLSRVAHVLGVTVGYLLAGTTEPERTPAKSAQEIVALLPYEDLPKFEEFVRGCMSLPDVDRREVLYMAVEFARLRGVQIRERQEIGQLPNIMGASAEEIVQRPEELQA